MIHSLAGEKKERQKILKAIRRAMKSVHPKRKMLIRTMAINLTMKR